jgi:hypothetical protein
MTDDKAPVADTDPNTGHVTIDIPLPQWGMLTTQGRIAFVAHTLIDFMASPAFHSPLLKSVRLQVRERGVIIPTEVICHIGDKLILDQKGRVG